MTKLRFGASYPALPAIDFPFFFAPPHLLTEAALPPYSDLTCGGWFSLITVTEDICISYYIF